MAGMLAFFTRAGNGTGMTEGGSCKEKYNTTLIRSMISYRARLK
jgi:hypothetical protein